MVSFMPRKKRSEEEIKEILKAQANGVPISEICKQFDMSQTAYYRLIHASQGAMPKKAESKIKKLEKKLKEREREIALLKEILKKI